MNNNHYNLSRNTKNVQLGHRLLRGMTAYGRSVTKLVIMLSALLAAYALWMAAYSRIDFDSPLVAPVRLAMYVLLVLLLLAVPATLLWLWGGPLDAGIVQRNLIRAGLVNAAGEAPTLVNIGVDRTNPKIHIYKFVSIGIPLEDWMNKKEKLQSVLKATVGDIRQGKDDRHILVYAAPSLSSLPETIFWPGDSWPDTVLSLGESVLGPVLVNLKKTPHILVGGATGSGKTYLVLSLIYQALQKGIEVYVLDLKGGVDYPFTWKHGTCHYTDDRTVILSVLTELVHELEIRKIKFQETEQRTHKKCPDLTEYNTKNPGQELSRILVACDELAEITDTTGMDKATKEQIAAITGKLGTLARLGRAFGLHLLMATQRPDANVLPGQVKNNADVRICGKADNVLSTIIMDNGDAASLPKEIPGRFLCNLNNGTIFQGYVHPDLEEGTI